MWLLSSYENRVNPITLYRSVTNKSIRGQKKKKETSGYMNIVRTNNKHVHYSIYKQYYNR